jgi:hypothetical protein
VKTIPVDTTNLTTLVGGAIQAATQPDGTQRTNRAGQPLFNVPVIVVIDGGDADTLVVRVPGPVAQIPPLAPVKLVKLVGRPWSMDGGRSGVSFSAESVQPVNTRSA